MTSAALFGVALTALTLVFILSWCYYQMRKVDRFTEQVRRAGSAREEGSSR
ncbi:MAG: hypothetical protein M3N51_01555 [Actinomycetota bacterium]|nr:hypothetical protein [Actinomycetota bacterium]